MNYYRFMYVCFFLSLKSVSVDAQFRTGVKPMNLYALDSRPNQTKTDYLLLANQTQNTYTSPILHGTGTMPLGQTNSYWLTRMTTQSIHEGKMGTMYLWDQQGNLRESRFFVEVGGKRKTGLKLVYRRR